MSYTKTFITIKEAAKMLGLAESTLRGRKAGTHKLTRVKHGSKSVRMIRQELEAHLEKLCREGRARSGTLDF
jgi:excisionase family DNA binding protein